MSQIPLSHRLVFHAPFSYCLVFHTPLSYRLVCHTVLYSLTLQLCVICFEPFFFNVNSHFFYLTVLCNGSDHAFQQLIHGDDVEKMECEEITIKNRPQDGKYNQQLSKIKWESILLLSARQVMKTYKQ